MYKFLIKQYETKLFDSYLFNLALTYYIKKGNFNTVKEIIENTNWKTEKNYHIVKICALYDCSLYQKTSYKLFNFLFSHIAYREPPQTFTVTGEDMKKYDLYKVVENCITTNKLGFLKKLLKDYSHINLIEHILEYCVKTYSNSLCQEYYELYKSAPLCEDIIRHSIKYKNIPMLEYISKEKTIFMRYSSWKVEKFPNNPQEHYYNDQKRYLELMEISHKDTDKIIIKHIKPKDFCFCLKELLNRNRNKTVSIWLEQLHQNNLPFVLKDLDVLGDIKVNIEKLSLKSFVIYYKLAKEKTLLSPVALLSDDKYVNNLNTKILNAISHNKLGYLNFIKTQFKLEKILFNSFLIDSYYTEMSPNSIKLDYELLPLSLEKKINLCLNNKENSYLTRILKDHPWTDIEKICINNKISPANTQYILYHYMNQNLDNKGYIKKIKI